MEIKLIHIGHSSTCPAKIIELTIEGLDSKIVTDITDINGKVDESFIENLRAIADELEEQNNKVQKMSKNTPTNPID